MGRIEYGKGMNKAKGSFQFECKMVRFLIEAFLANSMRKGVNSCDCRDCVGRWKGDEVTGRDITLEIGLL